MWLAIGLGILGLIGLGVAYRANRTVLGCASCFLMIGGTLQMVSCQFDFPWLLYYVLGALLGLLLVTQKKINRCSKGSLDVK